MFDDLKCDILHVGNADLLFKFADETCNVLNNERGTRASPITLASFGNDPLRKLFLDTVMVKVSSVKKAKEMNANSLKQHNLFPVCFAPETYNVFEQCFLQGKSLKEVQRCAPLKKRGYRVKSCLELLQDYPPDTPVRPLLGIYTEPQPSLNRQLTQAEAIRDFKETSYDLRKFHQMTEGNAHEGTFRGLTLTNAQTLLDDLIHGRQSSAIVENILPPGPSTPPALVVRPISMLSSRVLRSSGGSLLPPAGVLSTVSPTNAITEATIESPPTLSISSSQKSDHVESEVSAGNITPSDSSSDRQAETPVDATSTQQHDHADAATISSFRSTAHYPINSDLSDVVDDAHTNPNEFGGIKFFNGFLLNLI
jgi:hypothetical protein